MDDNFIYKVNISGTKYHITRKTLLKIPYFADYYEDYDGDHTKEIFVERSPELFKHVYAYVLDPLHPYPAKYYYELDKYGIVYDKEKLYDKNKNTDDKLNNINDRLDIIKIKQYKCNENVKIIKNKKPDNICKREKCSGRKEGNSDYCNDHKCRYCDNYSYDGNFCNLC